MKFDEEIEIKIKNQHTHTPSPTTLPIPSPILKTQFQKLSLSASLSLSQSLRLEVRKGKTRDHHGRPQGEAVNARGTGGVRVPGRRVHLGPGRRDRGRAAILVSGRVVRRKGDRGRVLFSLGLGNELGVLNFSICEYVYVSVCIYICEYVYVCVCV